MNLAGLPQVHLGAGMVSGVPARALRCG